MQIKSSWTSDSKMNIFPWLSNIYRWRIYLWNLSYAFRKRARSLSVRAALSWNYKLLYLTSFFKALHIKLVTCVYVTLVNKTELVTLVLTWRSSYRLPLRYISRRGISGSLAWRKTLSSAQISNAARRATACSSEGINTRSWKKAQRCSCSERRSRAFWRSALPERRPRPIARCKESKQKQKKTYKYTYDNQFSIL